jgi:hypothetical protein
VPAASAFDATKRVAAARNSIDATVFLIYDLECSMRVLADKATAAVTASPVSSIVRRLVVPMNLEMIVL